MSISSQLNNGLGPAPWTPETLLAIAWRHKGLVAVGIVIGMIVSAAIGAYLPRSYQSSAQLSIIKKRPDPVTGIDTRNMSAEENVTPPADLFKSAIIIDRAIQAKGLDELALPVPADQSLSEHIRNTLTVVQGKAAFGEKNVVFKLGFRSRTPEDSRTVLAAILDSYKEFMDKKHQSVSEDTIELILRDKTSLEKQISEQEAAYRSFREKAPLLGKTRDGLELRQERLNSIQSKRSVLLLQKVELESQLAALETARKEGRSNEAILAMLMEFNRKNDAAEPGRERQANLQDQLFPLLMEERKLAQIHGSNHPEVKEIRNRIEIARRLMILPVTAWKCDFEQPDLGASKAAIDPVQLYVQVLTQKLQHVNVSESLLATVFQTEQDEASRLAAFEIQNDSFRTRLNMNQQLYEALVKRLNDVSLIRNVGGYQIELLEPPSLGKRVAPSMTIALALGAVLGLILGLVLACRAESKVVGA